MVRDTSSVRTPCTTTIALPRVDKAKVVPLTVEQVRSLAKAMPDRYRLVCCYRLRWGCG